jgi:hypothetical protein
VAEAGEPVALPRPEALPQEQVPTLIEGDIVASPEKGEETYYHCTEGE